MGNNVSTGDLWIKREIENFFGGVVASRLGVGIDKLILILLPGTYFCGPVTGCRENNFWCDRSKYEQNVCDKWNDFRGEDKQVENLVCDRFRLSHKIRLFCYHRRKRHRVVKNCLP
ncbi:hypothetical protein RRG08_066175 [Elysia crispata]|uniref:Uncharacterized protein n=1 Tax=Elysia crispata TaxID=231223 RepID=A0AAE1D1G9_9GAST|nr:hypothetical protein RRG08_066175 [Elysia crispata]